MNTNEPNPPPPHPPPLDYYGGGGQEMSPGRLILEGFLGWLIGAGLIGAAVIISGFLAFGSAYGNDGIQSPWNLVIGGILLLAIGLVVLFALLARRSPRRKGFEIGLWIGLGCGLLHAGLCFGAM